MMLPFRSGGRWLGPVRAIALSLTTLVLPGSVIALAAIVLGGSMLYPAWHEPLHGGFKPLWIDRTFFTVRAFVYVAAWLLRAAAEAVAVASMAANGSGADGNDASEAHGMAGEVRSEVPVQSAVASEPDTAERKQLRKNWAALIRPVYEVDPLVCPCGATMRIVAVITERSLVTTILAHLREAAAAIATEGPTPRPVPPPAPRAGARPLRQLNPPPAHRCDHQTGRSLLEHGTPGSADTSIGASPASSVRCDERNRTYLR